MTIQLKFFWRRIFSGASENDNICSFPLHRDGWKDLMREEQVFFGASENEYFS
ncbi:MAG: hypothetical protein F6K40_00755 [Okeania sp. SIO3I5]|uniref:hypothetical protein n=1 Tax=Okeania sp. SIO3I5 TaxID=2607805 RepID=UPI0013B75356|nr:hypothetical protein [Okeania sp. SIO3I5]NEQ34915.1 hypothetical protein [Okeania sp. SIO3I5]